MSSPGGTPPTPADQEPPAIWVEIESTDPQIVGRVHRGCLGVTPFEGWLELLSMLGPD
jgi:hypothetical protein